jgi:GTP-binding protein
VTKPIILVANKCDTPELEPNAHEFYKLGRGKLVCISAHQHRGRDELLHLIRKRLPPPTDEPPPNLEVALKVAIVGRRNTGKSTFINQLAQAERMIVSEVPGTTRDSVDVRFERDGKAFIAIDTAGVRRKKSIGNDIEFYSLARAERSIRRADVVLLFLDPRLRISKVDKQLANYILEQHKPAIFVVNKWDLMVPMPTGKFGSYVRAVFPSLDFLPIAFITAKSGKNVQAVLNLAQNLHKQASRRVATGDLNKVLRAAVERQAPPMRQNRRPKIFYATQVATNPPTIVLFTNDPTLFDNTYQRYLISNFRDHLGFGDVPIKLYLRSHRREGGAEEAPDTVADDVSALTEAGVGDGEVTHPAPKAQAGERERPRRESGLWTDV